MIRITLFILLLTHFINAMTPIVLCGNGNVDPLEGCDDGGVATGDGCDNTCVIESGWTCDASTGISTCVPRCGDQRVIGTERCDDGNTIPNDGCSPSCLWEPSTWCDVRYLPTLCFKLSYTRSTSTPHALTIFNITLSGIAVSSNRDVVLQPPHPRWQIRLSKSSLCTDDAAGTSPQVLTENDMTLLWFPLHEEQEVVVCIMVDDGSGSSVFNPLPGVFNIIPEPYSVAYTGIHMAGYPLRVRLRSATLQGLSSTADLRVKLSLRKDCTGDSLGTSPSPVAPDLTALFNPRYDGQYVWVCLSENVGISYSSVSNFITVYPQITFDGTVLGASINSEMSAQLRIENRGVAVAKNLQLSVVVTNVLASPLQMSCLQGRNTGGSQQQCVFSCTSVSTEAVNCNITIAMLSKVTISVKSTIIDLAEDESQDLSMSAQLLISGAGTELTVNASSPLNRPNLVSTVNARSEDPPDCVGSQSLSLFRGFFNSQQQCEQTLGCFWDDPGYYLPKCSPSYRRLMAEVQIRNYEASSVGNYVSVVVSVSVIGGSNRDGTLIRFDNDAADKETTSRCSVSTSVSRVVCVLPEIRDAAVQLTLPFWVSAAFTGEVLCTTFVEASTAWSNSEPVSSSVEFTGVGSQSPTLNSKSRNDTFGSLEDLTPSNSAEDLWWMYVLIGICVILLIALAVFFIRRFFCNQNIELTIIAPSGREEVVDIPTTKTIRDLKLHLESIFGIPLKYQILESNPDKVLRDDEMIKGISSIVPGSVLSLFVITPTESVIDSNPLDELFPAGGQSFSPTGSVS